MYDESDTPRLFPETRSILEACRFALASLPTGCLSRRRSSFPCVLRCHSARSAGRDKQITMAVASRTPTPKVASAFLHKLGEVHMPHALLLHCMPHSASKLQHPLCATEYCRQDADSMTTLVRHLRHVCRCTDDPLHTEGQLRRVY